MRNAKTLILRWLDRLTPAWALIAGYVVLALIVVALLWWTGLRYSAQLAAAASPIGGNAYTWAHIAIVAVDSLCAGSLAFFGCAICMLAWTDHKQRRS